MRIVAIDHTSSERSSRNTRRLLSAVMHRITPRIFVGNLPERVIKELIVKAKKKASRVTDLLIFVESNSHHTGWTIELVGNKGFEAVLHPFMAVELLELTDKSKQLTEIIRKIESR